MNLTMLNSMAGADFETALDLHRAWGLRVLDLKNGIYGKSVEQLEPTEAERAARAISERNLRVHTLSTTIFWADIEQGETAFRARFLPDIERILETARILRPRVVRLLAARTSQPGASLAQQLDTHAWLVPFYREAIDRIHDAGFKPAIENEAKRCILATTDDVLDFFTVLDRADRVSLIWDITNLWQMGEFPTLETYLRLKPLISLVHVKGGRSDSSDVLRGPLRWASRLADASWPVQSIVEAVMCDGVVDTICLNPSHGEKNDGYTSSLDDYQHDLQFLRQCVGNQ